MAIAALGGYTFTVGIPAYGLSILRRQLALLGADFSAQYPEDWLIWNAGPWRPATTALERNLAQTQQPTGTARPAGEDSICYLLRTSNPRITVGRATINDLIINDLTTSRHEFVLLRENNDWFVDESRDELLVGGRPCVGRSGPLSNGTHLTIAELDLTFFTSAGLASYLASLP